MGLHERTVEMVKREKFYTARVLELLDEIDRQKIFCDWGYPTIYKYITKGLGYSDSEANIRVGALRLIQRAPKAKAKIAEGSLNLTNAAQANTVIKRLKKEKKLTAVSTQKVLELSLNKSTREVKRCLNKTFNLPLEKTETITIDERLMGKLERLRKIYGDISSYELFDILCEEKLKTPAKPVRKRSHAPKVARYIPKSVKHKVHDGKCQNCHTRRNLQYDHTKPFAVGGDNSSENIRILCENCNKRAWYKRTGVSSRPPASLIIRK